MKILCPLQDLREAFTRVMHAVPTRTTMEALYSILVKAETGRIKLYSYNLETGIVVTLPCDVYEEGMVTFPAKFFQDMLRKLPNEVVSIEADEKMLHIEAGKANFNIPYLNPDDYPEIKMIEDGEKKCSVRIGVDDLTGMVGQTLFSAATDSMRRLFNSIYFNVKDKRLDVVALDGYRLAMCTKTFAEEEYAEDYAEDYSLIIPSKSLKQLIPSIEGMKKSENQEDALLTISSSSNKVLFEYENFKMISSIFEGQYCEYRSMLPGSFKSEFIIDRSAFLAALERSYLMMPVQDDRRLPVRIFSEGDNLLKIESSTDRGRMHDEVNIEFQGDLFDIDFNPIYFMDALKVIPDEKVRIRCNGELGPCTITPLEGDAYLYLILPVRR